MLSEVGRKPEKKPNEESVKCFTMSDDADILSKITNNEIDNLKKVCSEIFGNENFIAQ